MIRGFAPTIGLLALLVPALAHAQTNLDQGKSAAQIFASDCAECHKAAHGLANGKNSATLSEFLREHYTTSRDQAAALAAYVLGGRGGDTGGAAAQGRGQKPAAEHASAAPEEPKPAKRQARQPGKPDEGTSATAKPRPNDEAAKPADDGSPPNQPSVMFPDTRPAAVARSRRKDQKASPPEAPAAVAHAPATVAAEPAPTETPTPEASPAPAMTATPAVVAPPEGATGEPAATPTVPRDDVPD